MSVVLAVLHILSISRIYGMFFSGKRVMFYNECTRGTPMHASRASPSLTRPRPPTIAHRPHHLPGYT